MRSRSSRAPAPRAAFVVFGAFRAKQLDWRETWRIRHPLTNDATNAAPCCASRRHPRGLARARAQCGVRHAQPSRGGERWRSAELAGAHKSPRSGPETGFPGPWHPQSPSHGVTNPNLAGLAPTNPLGWGRESEFPAGWRPQIASGGDANPRFAPVGTQKSPRVGTRIRVSRRLAPTNPLGWCRESAYRAVGTHKSPPVVSRIRVSRRLAPTNPLGWGRESEFRAGWRPQIPSGGDANPRFAAVGAHKSPPVVSRILVSGRLAPTDAANRRARGPGR